MKKIAQTMKAVGSSDVVFGPMFAPLFSESNRKLGRSWTADTSIQPLGRE
jgi:hypothetical protein